MVGLAADQRARGLAASVVDIGMVIGLGIIQRTEGDAGTGVIEKSLRSQNPAPISERDLHQMLAEAIVAGSRDRDVEIITGLQHYVSSSPNRPSWYNNPRFSHLVTEGDHSDQPASALKAAEKRKQTVAHADSAEEALSLLERVVITYLATELKASAAFLTDESDPTRMVLQLPAEEISPGTTVLNFGVASLVAASLRTWLLAEQGVDVPVLKILGGSSIRQSESDLPCNDFKDGICVNSAQYRRKPFPNCPSHLQMGQRLLQSA